MSKIEWDKTGEKLYETGVDRGVVYYYDRVSRGFTNGEVWNGLTAVNETPSGGEANPTYADNIKYLNLISAEDYGITIECYSHPDSFKECIGEVEFAPGATIGQQKRKLFAFCYRTLLGNDTKQSDYGYTLNVVYNCQASPAERSHSTVNDSPEPVTLSFDIATTPLEVPDHKPTAIVKITLPDLDAATLKVLEFILYGTNRNEPRLPYPAEMLEIVNDETETRIWPASTLYPDDYQFPNRRITW